MMVPGDKTLADLALFARLFHKKQMREVILIILLEIGITPKGKGLDYLTTAIQLYVEQPSQMITKGLYPRICDNMEIWCTPIQVERAIRFAIRGAWMDRQNNGWRAYFFGNTEDKCPTNADFIAYIARVMSIWMGIAEQEAEMAHEEETV